MSDFFNEVYNLIMTIINNSTVYGPLFAAVLIFLESIIPVLPLFVFITIIFISYGYGIGFIISYILTCCGCFFSFFLTRKIFAKTFKKHFRKNKQFNSLMQKIDKISLSTLSILVAIPFTPAFLINITSSLSNMKFKKFAFAILIGKLSLVFFWGFIGTSLVESLKNPRIVLIILFLLLMAFLLSKILAKKLEIE